MYNRACFLFVTAALLMTVVTSYADTGRDRLAALLPDSDGWVAADAEYFVVEIGDASLQTVRRSYIGTTGQFATAVITAGPVPYLENLVKDGERNINGVFLTVGDVDSVKVIRSHTVVDNMQRGSVVAEIYRQESGGVLFLLEYRGMDEKEALAFAKSFDWNHIRTTLAAAGAK